MPLYLPKKLPSAIILSQEHIDVRDRILAAKQKNGLLRIGILNLMPLKIPTELDLLRMLSHTAHPIDIEFIRTSSYLPKNTDPEYLRRFYKTTDDIRHEQFDGLIITGAPLGHLEFEKVKYWKELKTFMAWADEHARSSLYICWGAMAALYARYGIPKYPLQKKCFGVFSHHSPNKNHKILSGFDEYYPVPHSRLTEIRQKDVECHPDLELLSVSEDAGILMLGSTNGKRFYITGHFEYAPNTLNEEYQRDLQKGIDIEPPANYFPGDNPTRSPEYIWQAQGQLLFSNWINYFVHPQ